MSATKRFAVIWLAASLAGWVAPAHAQTPTGAPNQAAPTQHAAPTATPALPPAEEVTATEPGASPIAPAAAQQAAPANGQPVATELQQVGGMKIPHDLSPIGMFLAADWVVKGVMIGLAFASLVTWTVFLVKVIEIAAADRRAKKGLSALVASRSLEDARSILEGEKGAVPVFVAAADAELAYSGDALSPEGVKERVASHLSRLEAQAGRRLTIGTGLLATIGSTAPFVGLFGTVWGIMNSFIGISNAQTTNLAVVAPGIAEALLATAIGLVAAIPAVVIYNVFARAISAHRAALADASAAVLRLVSRDLDRLPGRRLHAAAE
ncbi:tonB-system energizer ExbB [Hansschlegelia quercus]|uniref:Biopolymer transport protein ExbB n=1 Tax=Hansschlegelia quercus TaxID=2528245 RepID=A0A4Q9GHP7_9HYPH|nr:tonB-system energizer ExbB [Hansschlegelia quercus]TBN53693.1 tonB-system energizer ExbB [Hansschlegelia quercus]